MSKAMTRLAILLLSILDVNGSDHLRRNLRDLQESNLFHAFVVPIRIVLRNLDEEVARALETKDMALPLVYDFCQAVQVQAGGIEATSAANELGIAIETSQNSTLESMITTTLLRPSNVDPALVTLEVSVLQVVYAAAFNTSNTITLDLIRELVENGFNPRRGGNAQFLELLYETNPTFGSTLEVDVLGLESLDTPTLVPSMAPSYFASSTTRPSTDPSSDPPTSSPTTPPTIPPTSSPTNVPSTAPTTTKPISSPTIYPTASPTIMPSSAPTLFPTLIITGLPTMTTKTTTTTTTPPPTPRPATSPPTVDNPTLAPSTVTTSAPILLSDAPVGSPITLAAPVDGSFLVSTQSPTTAPHTVLSNNNTLEKDVIVAIACVASVAILACCCIALVHQRKRNKEETDDDSGEMTMMRQSQFEPHAPQAQGTKRHFGSRSSRSSKSTRPDTSTKPVPFIPTEVNLGDDGQSLADTTLGDQTAGRKPPKKKQMVNTRAKYEASFDEESLYTSNETPNRKALYGIQQSSEIDEEPVESGTDGLKVDYNDFFAARAAIASDPLHNVMKSTVVMGEVPPSSPIANKISALIDTELDGNDSDSFHSGVYMSDADSPISVALSNCEIKKKKNSREYFELEISLMPDSPLATQGVLGLLERPVSDVEVVANLDEVAKVDVKWHDSKLLHESTSSDSKDLTPSDSDRSPTLAVSHSDSQSISTKQIVNLVSSADTIASAPLPQENDVLSPSRENHEEFVAFSPDSIKQSARPVKRPAVKPWATTTLQYRTRPLDSGVQQPKSRRFTPSPLSTNVERAKDPLYLFDTDKDFSLLSDSIGDMPSFDFESASGTSVSKSITSRQSRGSRESKLPYHPTSTSVGSRGLDRTSSGDDLSGTESSFYQKSYKSDRSVSSSIVSGVSKSASSHASRVSSKQRVVVLAPAGKLGIVLANRHEGSGTVISEVRPFSALAGALVAGDKLLAIDGVDVSSMDVSGVTSILASKSEQERQLTLMTTKQLRSRALETQNSSPLRERLE